MRHINEVMKTGVDFYMELSKGNIPNHSVIHKFGENDAVGTTYVPIALDGVYKTPSSSTALEILSDDANDTSAGTGARKVYVQGLDASFNLQSEEVTMNGLTAVTLVNDYTRVFRMYVSESGTYATASIGSHAGNITLRESGGGDTWGKIEVSGFSQGQTQIGCYTVPNGYTAYIKNISIHSESTKPATILMFKREDADVVTAPYSTMRLVLEFEGVVNQITHNQNTLLGPFPAKTDIGFLAKLSTGTGSISTDFEIILVKD